MQADGAATFDAAHWEELQSLFARFENISPSEREKALETGCPDAQLRRRVLALLQAADAAAQEPAAAHIGKWRPDAFIGPYRLVREIGAGGIGAVYLAERLVDGVTLRSALKILAPHAVDASFVERFYREQQHLAALDHPNITRLLDAGWAENGQPYLVMEYVEGTHLDAYCDRRHLWIADRLRLFLQVCDAVSYAHRSLIVHLDLKPSNILVSNLGKVKLLDFGTSKLIRLDGNSTSTVMATPTYASPEQLLNQPVSTASDVYGLGTILFELLVGHPPFKNASAAARTEAAVREIEPELTFRAVTPDAAARRGLTEARLRQALRGDLAAIVAACLHSQPRDRYPSVDTLSEEIKRYLSCRPVLARGQSLSYAAMKFVRRQRLPVAVSCVVILTVAFSLVYAWSQQQHALHEAERSVRMQTFLFSLFKMANPNYTGKPVATVPEFLKVGMAKLPGFIHESSDLRAAQLGLAESMFESGSYADARAAFAKIAAEAGAAGDMAAKAEAEIYAGAVEFQDGKIAQGRILAADALKLARGPAVASRIRVLSEIYYAFNEDNNGFRTEENLQLLRAAVRDCRALQLPPRETALALSLLAGDLVLRGRDLEAKPIFEQLLALYTADPSSLCDRSEVYGWLAWIDDATGSVDASLPLFRKAYDGYVACAGSDSRGALDQLPYWADALIKTGKAPEAVKLLESALPTWRRVAGRSADQSDMLYFLTRSYLVTGRNDDAEKYANELLELLNGNLSPESRDVGAAHLVLGEALAAQRRYAEAQPHAQAAVRLLVHSAVSPYGRQQGAEATELLQRVSPAMAPQP
ncbi:MAG: protein kinase domain-containing protein [Steroidobacteraceae bacterium]